MAYNPRKKVTARDKLPKFQTVPQSSTSRPVPLRAITIEGDAEGRVKRRKTNVTIHLPEVVETPNEVDPDDPKDDIGKTVNVVKKSRKRNNDTYAVSLNLN